MKTFIVTYFRVSVRIESIATYNTGLFILDLNQAPWGCGTPSKIVWHFPILTCSTKWKGVWPAFWTVGGNWPYVRGFLCTFVRPADGALKGGEIDIIEGVHDNQHNQVAWHTAPGRFKSHTILANCSRILGCLLNTTAGFTGTISVSSPPQVQVDPNCCILASRAVAKIILIAIHL